MFADVRLHFRRNAQLFHGCVRVVSNHQRTVKHALPDGLLFRHPLIFAVHAERVVADQPAQQRAHQRKRNQRPFRLRMMIDGKDNQQNNRRRECQRHLRLGSAEKSHADGKQNHPQPAFPAAARHRFFCAAFNYCALPGWNMQSKYDRIENETPGEEKDNVER